MKLLTTILFICLLQNLFAQTAYFVSNGGSDANNGLSSATPFQTISKINSLTLNAGDQIYFNRGDVFYGQLVINNSGNSSNPILISDYGSGSNPNPIITGFANVTSWTNLGINIWESTGSVSSLSQTNMVVINGVNTQMGTYPNLSGGLPVYITCQSATSTSITSSSLTGAPDWTGADVVFKPNHWTLDRATITSQSGSTINFAAPTTTPVANYGFFIQNDIRTLDVQNEWYFNPSTKKIDIYSSSSPTNVQVAGIDTLINIGTSNYITFKGLNIQGANKILLYSYKGNNTTITNCNFSYSGADGIQLGGSTHFINGNTFSDCGNNAVFLFYGGASTVTNNTVTRTGLVTGFLPNNYTGGGIRCTAPGSLIQYNFIDSTGCAGINFRGANVQVRNNFVNHSALLRDDIGGIYTGFASETGKIIDGNIVLNTMGNKDGTANNVYQADGIYIDDLGNNVVVTNNTIAGCNSTGIYLHNVNNIVVRNNTVYNNGSTQSARAGSIMNQQQTGYTVSNITATNNILFANNSNQYSLYITSDNQDITTFGTLDSNYYARPISDANYIKASQMGATAINYNLTGWKTFYGQDAHSQGSPKSVSSTDSLRFEYNATTSSKNISLSAKYIDVKGNVYNGSIALEPYGSAILTYMGALVPQTPRIYFKVPYILINLN